MATLYVTEPGARVEKEYRHLLVMSAEDEARLRVPLADVDHVALVGEGTGVTTPALYALLRAGATLSIIARDGELLGRLTPPAGKHLELRRRQYARAAEPGFCLALSRRIAVGKLHNLHALALRWGRGRPPLAGEPEQRIAQAVAKVEAAGDLAGLRAAEGAGSKAYFAVLRGRLREGWSFERRSRRPPRDPANALLSLGYTLLGDAAAAALETVGLDPYEGFYHADKYGRPALALDLMEEFRGPVADSVAITVINKGMLTPEDFEERGGGFYLSRAGLSVYLREFSDRLQTTFTHPLAGRPLTYQKCLEVQARQLAKVILGQEAEYRPLRVR